MANQLVLVGTVDAGVMRVRVSTAYHGIGLSVVGLSEHKAFHFHFRLVAPAADLLSGVLRSACDGESSDREVDDFDVQVRVVSHLCKLSAARRLTTLAHSPCFGFFGFQLAGQNFRHTCWRDAA